MTNKEKSELKINSGLVLNDLLKLQKKVRIIHGLAKNLLDFDYNSEEDIASDGVLIISLDAICALSAPKNV